MGHLQSKDIFKLAFILYKRTNERKKILELKLSFYSSDHLINEKVFLSLVSCHTKRDNMNNMKLNSSRTL